MMTSYQEYIAVLKRMKEIEAKGTAELFYYHCSTSGHSQACQDKATIYDSEHDQTSATVEWLREVLGEPTGELGHMMIWRLTASVEIRVEGSLIRFMASIVSEMCRNPTRGDVLTALRLFKKEGA